MNIYSVYSFMPCIFFDIIHSKASHLFYISNVSRETLQFSRKTHNIIMLFLTWKLICVKSFSQTKFLFTVMHPQDSPFLCKKEKECIPARNSVPKNTLSFDFYFVKSNYILIGSFDGTPAFLGYFFGVAEIFLIFTRVRSASAPIKEK